jgi:hypothetical protein
MVFVLLMRAGYRLHMVSALDIPFQYLAEQLNSCSSSVSVRPFVRMFLLWWLNWLIERHANLLCLPAWNEEQGQSLPPVEDRAFLPSTHMSTLSG